MFVEVSQDVAFTCEYYDLNSLLFTDSFPLGYNCLAMSQTNNSWVQVDCDGNYPVICEM